MSETERKPSGALVESSGEKSAAASATANIHDRTGLYISIIALLVAGVALGIAIMAPQLSEARYIALEARVNNLANKYDLAERESRVVQERWNDLKVELAKRNIPLSDH